MPFQIRKSPMYYCDIWVPDRNAPDAIHINQSLRTRDHAEACRREDELRADAEERYYKAQSGLVDIHDYSLSDALEWVYEHKWQHNKAGDQCRARVEEIISLMGDMPLAHLSGQRGGSKVFDIRSAILKSNDIKGRSRGKTTADRYLSNLNTLLRAMRDDRKIADLDPPKMPYFNEDNRRTRVLRIDEEVDLFTMMERDGELEFADFCRFLLDTGMRRNEALSIDFRSPFVNLRLNQITVASLKKKGSNNTRTMPLTERAKAILIKRLELTGGRGLAWDWKGNTVSKKFKRYRNRMGPAYAIDTEFTLHMLRHTCTSRLISNKVPAPVVKDWLGHSDEEMTLYYSHTQPEDMLEAVSVLNRINEKVSVQLSVQTHQNPQFFQRNNPSMYHNTVEDCSTEV